jgi:DNA-binding NarL/FixJ family response regulator
MSVKTPYFFLARATGVPALLREIAPARASNPWAARSGREAQVARVSTAGVSNREVAARLLISDRNVEARVGAGHVKLGVYEWMQLLLRPHAWTAPLPSPATELLA